MRFCNHAFDFRPNCTPLSAITIINVATYAIAKLHHVTLQIANILINVGRLQFVQVIKSKRKSIEIFIVLAFA